jgi:hypothetical protein
MSGNPWRASVNGPGKRPWFVWRHREQDGKLAPAGKYYGQEVASDARGHYCRFASQAAAQKAANSLNSEVLA